MCSALTSAWPWAMTPSSGTWHPGLTSTTCPILYRMLPSFVLLRRFLLLAWMGTHNHSRESQQMSITYAAGSAALAERYLMSNGLNLA